MSNPENEKWLEQLGLKTIQINKKFPGIYIGNETVIGSGPTYTPQSPIDASKLATLYTAQANELIPVVDRSHKAFIQWRTVPPPVRGELVRQIGMLLRDKKTTLAKAITHEAGKIVEEAEGEVQEMIDICEFAVGLSRQLYGLTIATERPQHHLRELWHPLGPVAVISAFNFPTAVWAWNAMLALVCGNPVIWKPSEKTPLCAIACHLLCQEVIRDFSDAPNDLLSVIIGDSTLGHAIAEHTKIPLVSATGSIPMGRSVAETVAKRLGRSLLELGGNNAAIITPSANLTLALKGIVFAAAGTCGQRCTTLRRLIVHESIAKTVTEQIDKAYKQIPIGDPRDRKTLVGPLVDARAFETMQDALSQVKEQGGTVIGGERITKNTPTDGFYVRPAIVNIPANAPIIQQETFAPILYIMTYQNLDEAIAIQNNVPQGLSSSIFTDSVREAETFLSCQGSDCGIANVNIGPSGAEIGGAFGGEKETGGGRESGSDAWKNYMRRMTATVNFGEDLPLAQGIQFDIDTKK